MALRHIHTHEFFNHYSKFYSYWEEKYVEIIRNNGDDFRKNASVDDTFIAIIAPDSIKEWNKQKEQYKDWIIYESPGFYNTRYNKGHGHLYVVVMEKPK